MSVNPRLFSLVASIGGDCAGVPWLISQKSGLNSSPAPVKVSEGLGTSANLTPSPAAELGNAKAGNCTVIKNTEDIIDMLWNGFNQLEGDYISLTCKETGDKIMPNDWTGVFPKDLFLGGGWKMTFGSRFVLTTETTLTDSNSYTTIFKGDQLKNGSVTGTWKESFSTPTNQTMTTVSVIGNPKQIYLIFQGDGLKSIFHL